MADTRSLVPQAQQLGSIPTDIGLWYGKIVSPAPATITDPCWVQLVDDLGSMPDNKWGPCRWSPRIHEVSVNVAESPESAHNIQVGLILKPKIGDEVLVAFDNQRYPWVVGWWPI